MKAILVFETDGDISKLYADIYKEDEKGNGEIVLGLPLKPLPQNMTEGFDKNFMVGWNACLEAITGDTE